LEGVVSWLPTNNTFSQLGAAATAAACARDPEAPVRPAACSTRTRHPAPLPNCLPMRRRAEQTFSFPFADRR
jgi:hypothetical protein